MSVKEEQEEMIDFYRDELRSALEDVINISRDASDDLDGRTSFGMLVKSINKDVSDVLDNLDDRPPKPDEYEVYYTSKGELVRKYIPYDEDEDEDIREYFASLEEGRAQ